MARINLLPTELAPKTTIIKLTSSLRSVVIFGFILVLFASVGIAIFIVYFLVEINITNSSNKTLETSVSNLNQTEQKFVLLRDRIKKADEIFSKDTTKTQIASIDSVMNNTPSEIVINEIDVTPGKWSLNFSTLSSSSLVTFMSSLVANSQSKKIQLTSFTFSGGSGYSISLDFF